MFDKNMLFKLAVIQLKAKPGQVSNFNSKVVAEKEKKNMKLKNN